MQPIKNNVMTETTDMAEPLKTGVANGSTANLRDV
jgi:hypothetical protein